MKHNTCLNNQPHTAVPDNQKARYLIKPVPESESSIILILLALMRLVFRFWWCHSRGSDSVYLGDGVKEVEDEEDSVEVSVLL